MRVKILLILLVATTFFSGCYNTASTKKEPVTREVFAMDTYMTLSAYGDNAEAALDASEKEIERIDAMLSTEAADSEIALLNRKKNVKLSPEAVHLISRAKTIGSEVGGVFDISIYPVICAWGFTNGDYRVPSKSELSKLLKHVDVDQIVCDEKTDTVTLTDPDMEIDLGGIAKGYTSDKVLEIMKANGVEHGLINLGGNVQSLGTKPDGSDWRVAIADPDNQSDYAGVITCHDRAVISSGGYQRFFEQDGKRYFHIIDVSDGLPAENGLISVTVVCEDGTLADALSTSLFIMGPKQAAEYWRSHHDSFDAVFIKNDGTIQVTAGIKDNFSTESSRPVEFIDL